MPAVLFVCTANQFRSPLAAAYFDSRLKEAGIAAGWVTGSAGTWIEQPGGAHPRAIRAAQQAGLDLSEHRAREVTSAILADADLILTMEAGQKEALQIEFAAQREKIFLLSEFSTGKTYDIPDPARDRFVHADEIAAHLFSEIDRAFPVILRRFAPSGPP